MKRNIFKTCVIGLGLLTLASCDDPMDELTSIIYDRVFSPVDLEARNVNETTATLQWVASKGAGSYTVEIYADDSLTFAGTPSQTLTVENNSVDIEGLVYDTKYSARVMANDSVDADRNSKWSEVYFRTAAEQHLYDLENENIADRQVTISWPAEIEMDSVAVCLNVNGSDGAAVTSRYLTTEEIAAGTATITGLQPETSYRIHVYLNGKERGSKTFTTIADLEGAILVHDTDDFGAMLEAAQNGDVFALYGGTHVISAEEGESGAGCAVISKSITIKGIYPTDIPVINGRFQIEDGASLTVSQIILDGANNTTGDQAFNYKTAGVTYNTLDVQNCEIRNFTKGLLYLNVSAVINTVTFNNCLIHDIECNGGDFYDSRLGLIIESNITNSTIYHCAWARDLFRIDDPKNNAPAAGYPTLNISNCTFDDVANASGKRLLYVRYPNNVINWSNNLTTNTVAVVSNQSSTSVPTFSGNAYYNTPNLSSVVEKTNLFTDENAISWDVDPEYKDAANGDFTIQNEDVSTRQIGDPRWYTAQE